MVHSFLKVIYTIKVITFDYGYWLQLKVCVGGGYSLAAWMQRASALELLTVALCYRLVVAERHEPAWLPFISDCAARAGGPAQSHPNLERDVRREDECTGHIVTLKRVVTRQ